MSVEVLLGIDGTSLGLFQKNELGFQVAIMLVVYDWSLYG